MHHVLRNAQFRSFYYIILVLSDCVVINDKIQQTIHGNGFATFQPLHGTLRPGFQQFCMHFPFKLWDTKHMLNFYEFLTAKTRN